MTRGGACVPRRLVARALGVERFEERWLLSTVGPASGPPQGAWVFPTSPIPALVSWLPVAAPGSWGVPDGIGEPSSVGGGMAPALAVRATVTAPASPPPDNSALPLVGTASAVGANGSMLMATTGFPDALDLAAEGPFPAPGTAPTTTPTIQVERLDNRRVRRPCRRRRDPRGRRDERGLRHDRGPRDDLGCRRPSGGNVPLRLARR